MSLESIRFVLARGFFLLLLLPCTAAPTGATLWDRGGGLIHDDVFNITWVQDADGLMSAAEAVAWADGLVYQGYDDWRLPDAYDMYGAAPKNGWNQSANEMGYMFYMTLGNQATFDVRDLSGLADSGPFQNLAPFRYWSGTSYLGLTTHWWYFNFGSGLQWDAHATTTAYAWAVRDGDSTPVPSPEALPLLLSGLFGFLLDRRKVR